MYGSTATTVGSFAFSRSTAAGSSFDATAFAGALAVVTGLLLVLSYSTTRAVTGSAGGGDGVREPDATDRPRGADPEAPPVGDGRARAGADDADPTVQAPEPGDGAGPSTDPATRPAEYPPWLDRDDTDPLAAMSTGMLLANVAVTQGVFLVAIVGAALLTGVPAGAMGVGRAAFGLVPLAAGVALGVGLYLANEVGAAVAEGAGIEYDERLRSVLAPDGAPGWLALLGFVLPLVAVFEEVLFRAAMVGVLAAGFGLSPWLLAVGSSLVFAAGHGLQGPAGVLVTGALGFVLAAAFVLTGSLVTVVVAHYLVNALEFGVHEGLGLEWV